MTRKALITGASSGIGEAIALDLARRGYGLVLSGRSVERLENVASRARESGADVHVAPFDAETPGAEKEAIEKFLALPGRAALINNAGIAAFGPFHAGSLEDADRQIRINFSAPVALTHAVLPAMLEDGGGDIVNVLSIVAELTLPGVAVYSATKAGLLSFGKSILLEYRRRGVRVGAVLPGSVDTPIWGQGGPSRSDMLPSSAVAEAVAMILEAPLDRVIEEIVITPPKGVL